MQRGCKALRKRKGLCAPTQTDQIQQVAIRRAQWRKRVRDTLRSCASPPREHLSCSGAAMAAMPAAGAPAASSRPRAAGGPRLDESLLRTLVDLASLRELLAVDPESAPAGSQTQLNRLL